MLAKGQMESGILTWLLCSQAAARELSVPAPVTDRVNAQSTALADAELCYHDVVFPLGNFSDRLDMTKETTCTFSASHNLPKFPAPFGLIVRLLIPRKGVFPNLKFAKRVYGLVTPPPLAK